MRLVSLCPSITETVFALGRGDWLVGRTRYCVQPRGLVQRVPHLRGTKDPDVERIVALRPDRVFCNREENRKEDVVALLDAGLAVSVWEPRDIPSTAAHVRELGAQIDADVESEVLAARIESAARAAREAAVGGRPRVAYLVWDEPLMIAGDATYVAELLRAAGLDPLIGKAGSRYPEVAVEALRGVDAVLLPSEPYPFRERHRAPLAGRVGIDVSAVRLVDGEALSWHGARTVEGLRVASALAAELRGEMVAELTVDGPVC
jgi:ABC-type Fe3+-hydroxamate transport system substrate-binding protein